ncbi:hypothetical protein ICV32_02965 [Polynucleobacter sp. MWH-UH24A]|uniref:hypothetical protein n=1 Tax=Polynucleobacter sp. MWH-UH24A TaxID=2689110 RepID=UPI001BFE0907|nr:hypothetical protein [Polynucleobacter sp. MWH-UH24A]QWD76640.1 hypothetical protein ICV32_02965 [Polynucleobacter sp. MWH-UH24A]
MSINRLLIFISLIFVFNSSYGQVKKPEGKFCNTFDGRIEFVQNLIPSNYDWLLFKVENIPPDTEKYISTEYKSSLETRNESRFNKIVSNEYFYPWKLRDSYKSLISESKNGFFRIHGIGSSTKSKHESEIIFYTNLFEINYEFLDSLDEYRNFDNRRNKPYLSGDSYRIELSKLNFNRTIQSLIKCSFQK